MDPVVLIVDDNEDNRFTLSMRLEACGYENIVAAENGHDRRRQPGRRVHRIHNPPAPLPGGVGSSESSMNASTRSRRFRERPTTIGALPGSYAVLPR
jgi:hypothetical protein